MAKTRIRTVDFLPEIFRTNTNRQFLHATLDQLVQDPKLKPTQGYIGRRLGPGVDPEDNYVLEPTRTRTDYQLEPGTVFLEPNTNKITGALTYPGLIDSVAVKGGNTTRQDRLFASEYYSWDPFIDFDKFVNFSQYYWLPEGPDSVDVFATPVPLTDDFQVTRGTSAYTFSGVAGDNPTITLVRQGSYTFDVQQTGHRFWIQSVPGTSGVLPQTPNQSSREVLGVINNGDDNGTITFNVPAKSEQNFYYQLADAGAVDFATSIQFDQINNVYFSEFVEKYGGIDGITDINNRTIIFLTNAGWFFTGLYDSAGQPYDSTPFDETVEIGLNSQRYSVWRINLVYDDPLNPYIKLTVDRPVNPLSKLLVQYGSQYANISFYKNSGGTAFERIPLITADLDFLYYQDADNPELFGVIKLVDSSGDQAIDIADILGKKTYTSPNGVVFSNGLKVQFQGPTVPTSYSGKEYYVEGVGTAIVLRPVTQFITPEPYTRSSTVPYDSVPYDSTPYDESLNAPVDQDYITINRASTDYNAWSRSNRWFHVDIINATAQYNNQVAFIDNLQRAKRPIIEFRPNLKLFNMGSEAVDPINIIDFRVTDAMSDINGSVGYSIDGYALQTGSRIIFAADRDPEVRNKIYTVTLIQPTGSGTPVIDLQPADLNTPDAKFNQNTVCLSGISQQGKSFWFNGDTWLPAQLKTGVNQAPLFDVFDENGVSFSDQLVYTSSNFAGSKLFSYALGEGVTDKIIGQPLKYLTINNIGDIVFDNNLTVDQFVYVKDTVSVTVPINSGVVRQYTTIDTFRQLLGWQTANTEVVSRQSFRFTYQGQDLVVDVPVDTTDSAIPVKVFVNSIFLDTDQYSYAVKPDKSTVITFVSPPAVGDIVEVSVLSQVASPVGFYTVPLNLENNAVNADVPQVTLGTVRNHYGSICQNLTLFSGDIAGPNNTRDLGNLIPYGQVILQQGSPLTLASTFINDPGFDFFKSLEFNAQQYEKFKNVLMDTVIRYDWQNKTAAEILDECVEIINLGKNDLTPFYWTDTLPTGETFEETVYTVTPITNNTFDTLYSYNFDEANYRAILVYLNDVQLLGDSIEYTVATDGPRVTVLVPLAIGDKVTLREYTTTFGNFVPSTPTKLGLYPSYVPQIYLDDAYVEPTLVIRGHDGSITVAYSDIRDQVLLEFEKRIYNNLKVESNPIPLQYSDVVPGQFRTTDYSLSEINQILGVSFLAWVGANKLAYREQDYIPNNEFTWNYSSSQNKLNRQVLLGNWRGIYEYFYDTDAPNTRPWEMLGFSEKPTWWELEYGPPPYTSGNLVLWEDLANGLVMDPNGPYVIPKYKRPGLTEVVPAGSEGQLLPPFDVMVGEYDANSFRKSWTVGDDGPVEASWRKSSSWPFAVQRLLALTRPAEYFALFADRDLYRFNTEFDQYLYNNRFRIQPGQIEIYGNGVIKNSYINWIVDYNRQTGLDSTTDLKVKLENLDVRLCYRMAAFSDKQYIKIFTEKSSPNSLNTSLLLPDESYQLLLYRNPTSAQVTWSSVIVQKTETGYAVYGYSTTRPYFEIFASLANGNFRVITAADTVVRAPQDYSNTVVQVPYGYEFTGISSVVDFLLSYGRFMEAQGMTFEDQAGTRILNWNQMAQEFIYWSQQGWAPGSLINLNPVANRLNIFKPGLIAEPLSVSAPDDILLNQNKQALQGQDYVVERLGNDLTLRGVNNSTFSYLNAKFSAYEHMIVFDNQSVFADLIYDPATGARQSRLLFVGYTTYDWDGSLDAQGFILNQDNIQPWVPNVAYSKGQIVLYKDAYWSAVEIIPPESKFDFAKWLKSDYAQIQKGLLPNAATQAENIRNFYDKYSANLERDADLFAFGLIGFRPRRYMQNLNLDDISQVNLYSQFLGTKGTTQATDQFTQANLGKEVAEYEIFENWAILRSVYGANANRSYYEVRLNESLLLGNPATIQVIEPQQFSDADQTVQVNKLWKQSYKITNPEILPTVTLNQPDIVLPSAGYVNWDDADIKLFNFQDLSPIIADIENVLVGTSFWVAKDNSYDWNIYRSNLVTDAISQVRDNLNGTCTLTFAGPHDLAINQQIVIKYFGPELDGAYRVLNTPSLFTVTIALALPAPATLIEGNGVCFVLESMRVKQAADVSTLSYANRLLPGNKAWVDDDGTGHWVVYEKIDPFGSPTELVPQEPEFNGRFGSAISQGFGNLGALIGAPGANAGSGALYGYAKASTTEYVETQQLTMNANNILGYGSSVAAGNQQWAVSGAPTSWASQGYAVTINRNQNTGSFLQSQLITEVPYRLYQTTATPGQTTFNPSASITIVDPADVGVVINDTVLIRGTDWTYSAPNVILTSPLTGGETVNIFLFDELGYSVAISADERWMYVGAPAGDRVYAYNKIGIQFQSKQFVGDGSTTEFDVNGIIIVDSNNVVGATQVGVVVNNIPKIEGTDYVWSDGVVAFDAPPNDGDVIRITRLQSKTFAPVVPTSTYDISSIYTVSDIASFSVYVNDVLQRPDMDYSFNEATNVVTFLLSAPTGSVLFTSQTYWQFVDFIESPGISGGRFGHSVTTTTDGAQVVIGAPDDTADSKLLAGKTYVIDRSVERFTVTTAGQDTFTTLRPETQAATAIEKGRVYRIITVGSTNFVALGADSNTPGEVFRATGTGSGSGTVKPYTPFTVKVNATYLIPDDFGNNNGEFSVDYLTNEVTITAPLAIGDVVEISTNTFKLMQTIQSHAPVANAAFGRVADQCPTNCSLYIGQPNDSSVLPEAGSVERWINQNRLYGSIAGVNQDPTLTPDNTVRINNVDVSVSTPASWNNAIGWSANTFVISGSDIYVSLRSVPVGAALADTTYWQASSWVALYAADIVAADIPNVNAFASNGYLNITIANSDAAIPFTQLLVLPGLGNAYYDLGLEPMVWTQTVEAPLQIAYAHFGASLTISDDSRTLVVGAPQGTAAKPTTFDSGATFFDSKSTEFFDPLPESGVVYTFDLLAAANGSVTNPSKFVFGQQIFDEDLSSLDEFGTTVSYVGGVLLVGSPQDDLTDSVGDFGRVAQLNNIDRLPAWNVIYRQTPIVDVNLMNSVFMYDRLQSKITQYFDFIDPLQGKILGAARQNIDYLGAIDPAAYNTGPVNNYGDTWTDNHLGEIWWDLSTVRYIDYHQDSIAYRSRRWSQLFPGSSVDVYQWIESPTPPAAYQGPGEVYSTTSYTVSSKLNPDGLFAARYFFWVKNIREVATRVNKTLSAQAVAQYIENPRSSGIPYVAFISPSTTAIYNGRPFISAQDTILHIEFDRIANDDNVHVEYDLIATDNPNSFLSGGLYRKLLDSFCGEDTIGNKVPDPTLSPAELYGVQFRPRQSFFVDRFLALENYLQRANAILKQFAISDSRPFNLLNSEEPEPTSASGEWNKRVLTYEELTYQDLNEVPVGYKYLVASDSTQNGLWTIYTVVLGSVLIGSPKELLLSRVQNYDTKKYWEYIDWIQPGYNASIKPVAEVATFNDLARLTLPEGSSVKVTRNSFGKFEIYQYLSGIWTRVVLEDGTIRIKAEIWDYALGRFGFDIETFDSQYFDTFPGTETRQIIRAINEELLTGELLIFRNNLLMLVFDFILQEQIAPEWLFKTSLIDVNHKIRDLLPYQIFRQDNQDFVLEYIKEVKPYHVKIKEFNLKYEGIDTYQGTVTDFDCPAYYNTTFNQFISPILDDGEPPIDPVSSTPSIAPIWQTLPWSQWYQNYTLELQAVDVIEPGAGYTVRPQVIIGVEWNDNTAYEAGEQIFYRSNLYTVQIGGVTGDIAPTFTEGTQTNGTATLSWAGAPGLAVSRTNTAGQLVQVIVVDPGIGYITTPVITITGGNGIGARAVAVMGNELVRNFTTTIKFDRFQYTSQVLDWQPNTKYAEGQLVRFQDQVYSVDEVDDSSELDSGPIFDPAQYTLVNVATYQYPGVPEPTGLTAADRVIGLYAPTPNEPGRELAQVITGIDYPGVQVAGPNFNQNTGFDVGGYDINPFDNIDFGPEGRPTYDPAILDAIYESSFLDSYLGERTTDVIVAGGAFVDTYSSHAPEELVPGATFDTLDMRVYTRPGSDWTGDGHGFNIKTVNLAWSVGNESISFADIMAHAVAVRVVNVTNRVSLIPEEDYTVNWPSRVVTVINGAAAGDIVSIEVYGIGGGSQLYKESYPGNLVGNSLTVPVAFNEIYEFNIVVNGVIINNYTYAASSGGQTTTVSFANTYGINDWVVVTVLGITSPQKTWSFPVTQYIVYDGSTTTYTLDNSLQGTNDINLIVERQGQRLRPAESVEYIADGSSAAPYYLPTRGKINQGLISDNDVIVYVDQQRLFLAVDYTVSAWDGSSDRYVEFNTAPAAGARIVITVTTDADYSINGDQLILRVGAAFGAVLAVTTWNDTQEQGLLTQVFVGPTQTGVTIGEPYDSTDFDIGLVTGAPGSFDYTSGATIETNDFDTGRPILDTERLWVTLNGWRLMAGNGYTINGSVVTISGSIIGPGDVVAITSFTQTVVPEALAFRIFQDMLGIQKMYRILPETSTVLTQPLSATDDIIYVRNAKNLDEPDLENNIFGQLTINGERITYRERDDWGNTVSGLRRGTAGTGADSHAVDAAVLSIGRGELLPEQYQQNIIEQIYLADGTTTTYSAGFGFVNEIDVYLGGSIQCYLGPTIGTLVEIPQEDFTIISVDPITVQLNFIPDAGLQFRVTYTPTSGPVSTLTVPTTGATSRWAAAFSATDLVLQPESAYDITDLNPITVDFVSLIAPKRVVVINDLNSNTFFITQADVATDIFVTDISVTRPIQVRVGGTPVDQTQYSVSSVNPIVITFNSAPQAGLEIVIYIIQAEVLYAQGPNSASDGIPLQEQNTEAAWFIQGRV